MTIRSSFKKALAVLFAGVAMAFGGASAAQAQVEVEYIIYNIFGYTLYLDTYSCTGGLAIYPPFTISDGSDAHFTGYHPTLSSSYCNVRYYATVGGQNYGCQFQIQVNANSNGFAQTNAYLGAGGQPQCTLYTQLTEPGYTGAIFIQHQ